jgi:dolichyl-phosphate-mannose-protein mannosyltransferase
MTFVSSLITMLNQRVAKNRFLAWLPAVLIVIVGAVIRLTNLGYPNALLFDEKWYVPDAYALSKLGYEANWGDAGKLYDTFNPTLWADHALGAQDATHPPLAKWMIWLGMSFFKPTDPVGWRLSAAIVGSLLVVLVILVAHRLFRSVALATIAGLFLALDGHAIALSRLSVLDGFLAFWVLLAAYFLLRDRDQRLTRIATHALDPNASTVTWFRPWLWATAIALGAASATKVSGVVFVLAAGLYLIVSHILTRTHLPRRQRIRNITAQTIIDAVTALVLVAGTYLASWTGWFMSKDAMFRDWAQQNPARGLDALIPGPLRSLIAYQIHATVGASKIVSHNDLASPAWSWPLDIRPMALWIAPVKNASHELIALREVSTLGNPLLWWAACVALVILLAQVIRRKGFVPAFILGGFLAGWGPWMLTGNRTVFQTYSILFAPFMVLAVIAIMKTARDWLRTQDGLLHTFSKFVIPVATTAITLYALYFLPLSNATPLALDNYMQHMWVHAWKDLPSKPSSGSATTSMTSGMHS